jgi:transposase
MLRGHAAEFGVIAVKGMNQIVPLLAALEQEPTIPSEAKDMAALLGWQIEELDTRIKEIDVKLNAHKANEVNQGPATIPGVGPVYADNRTMPSIVRTAAFSAQLTILESA